MAPYHSRSAAAAFPRSESRLRPEAKSCTFLLFCALARLLCAVCRHCENAKTTVGDAPYFPIWERKQARNTQEHWTGQRNAPIFKHKYKWQRFSGTGSVLVETVGAGRSMMSPDEVQTLYTAPLLWFGDGARSWPKNTRDTREVI